MDQLPGFEAIEEPKEDDEVLPHPTEKKPKIAEFTKEDMDRHLMNKESQDILKIVNTTNSLLNVLKRTFLPLIM